MKEILQDGTVKFSYNVPADNIPGSYAQYIKYVDEHGNTIHVEKITHAPDGSIVHVKPK